MIKEYKSILKNLKTLRKYIKRYCFRSHSSIHVRNVENPLCWQNNDHRIRAIDFLYLNIPKKKTKDHDNK